MEHRITIAHPAAEVFAYLAVLAHLRHRLPQLRRESTSAAARHRELVPRALTHNLMLSAAAA